VGIWPRRRHVHVEQAFGDFGSADRNSGPQIDPSPVRGVVVALDRQERLGRATLSFGIVPTGAGDRGPRPLSPSVVYRRLQLVVHSRCRGWPGQQAVVSTRPRDATEACTVPVGDQPDMAG
jgi:hypothetical protein